MAILEKVSGSSDYCSTYACFKKLIDNLIKKEALTQVFYCEFCLIFNNNFLIEHLRSTISVTPEAYYTQSKTT